jgi:hypothetical protein
MADAQTVGALRRSDTFARRQVAELSQAVMLLIANGYVHPALPEAVRANARGSTDRLNATICAFIADGGDIARLAAATIGSELGVEALEALVVREKLSGRSMEVDALTDRILAALTQAGRTVQRDGKPVQDMTEARGLVRESVVGVVQRRLPILVRLGVI